MRCRLRAFTFSLSLCLGPLLGLPGCQSNEGNSGSKEPATVAGNTNTAIAPNPNGPPSVNKPPTGPQAPNGPAILYRGRFDTVTDPNVAASAWPGTELVFGFRGTQLSVTLSAPDPASYGGVPQAVYMAYAVDGAATSTIKLQSAKTVYPLAQGLPLGQHTVRLTKLTESQLGRVFYYGSSTDGAMTFTPPNNERRLEFVGDSGTAGYGALGTPPCSFSAATESADVAYPAVVGRLLSAEARNLSFSGKGLVQNRDTINDGYKTLPILWQRTLPIDDPLLLWDTNQWRPQAVIAVISGNDVYAGIPSQATFVEKLREFFGQLRSAYPQALLLFGASPMLRTNDPHPQQRATAIGYLQAAIAAAADANIQYIELPQDVGLNGTGCSADGCTAADPNCLGDCVGCDSHMTPLTHSIVANAIVAVLKAKLGW